MEGAKVNEGRPLQEDIVVISPRDGKAIETIYCRKWRATEGFEGRIPYLSTRILRRMFN